MFAALPLPALIAVFAAASAVILLCGLRMTGLADRLADRTGMGEALVGGVLLGASTSLSGTLVSLSAALDGRASLAFSNGIGGIAAQTAFLAVADIVYRRANLEHAAAELANVFQGAMLMLLLALPLFALTGPDVTLLGVHPVSIILVVVYVGGLIAVRRVREAPMWHPVRTRETKPDEPEEDGADRGTTLILLGRFAVLLVFLGVAGWLLSQLAAELIDRYALRASVVGALMTAVATSLPELVTTVAAVRRGALQLALGGIIGGNTFDVLFLTLADVGYREGSIYHAVGMDDYFWLATGMVMTAVLTLGLLYREKQGPGNIGLESMALLLIYATAIAVQVLG